MRTGFGYMPANLTATIDRIKPKTSARWDTNLSNALGLLDAAAASGVPVLINVGIDDLASKNFNQTFGPHGGGIDRRIPAPNPDLTDCTCVCWGTPAVMVT